jgi:hypothetical protein
VVLRGPGYSPVKREAMAARKTSPAKQTAHPAQTRPSKPVRSKESPVSKIPTNVKPMLATLVDKPFDRPGWLFEIKWDGYRTIAEVGTECVSTQETSSRSPDVSGASFLLWKPWGIKPSWMGRLSLSAPMVERTSMPCKATDLARQTER